MHTVNVADTLSIITGLADKLARDLPRNLDVALLRDRVRRLAAAATQSR